jgi:BlaR1 peptidase M56/Gram-negative bacterial TonB protein C-terminal
LEVVVEPTNMAAVMLQPIVVTAADFSQNLQNTEGVAFKILAAIYGLGVAVSLGKLLMGFWTIKRLLNRAERLPMDDFTLLQVQEAIAPFSFFRWVFINLNLVQSADLEQIILHEQAHVRERHSFDVVFAELLGVVFWWSPLVYFYTKSLKNVHEYAADEVVLRTSTPPQYGRLLLRQQQSGMSLSLANPFFSQLKKRILMMTRNPSKRRALVKYALAVPIFLVLTLLLASPKTKVMATTEAATDRVVASIETLEKGLINTANTVENPSVIGTEDAASVAADGMKVSLEDADGNALFLADKTLKISKLTKRYDRLKVVQYVNGTLTTLDVEQFSFVCIRNEKVMRVLNNGDKFDTELQQILSAKSPNDWFQIANIRTKQNGSKIAPRTWIVENAPPQYLSLNPQEQAAFLKTSDKPLVFLGGKRGGAIEPEELSAQDHLEAYQVIDGKAEEVEILSFVMFRIPRSEDPMQSNNKGGQFNNETKRMVEMAQVSDSYQFMEVKCRAKNGVAFQSDGAEGFIVKKINNTMPQYTEQKDTASPVYTIVEENPEFIGGQKAMFKWLGDSIRYPVEARRLKVEGTVYVGFVVEKNGSITNVKIKRNVPESVVDTVKVFGVDGAVTGSKIVKRQDQSCANEAIRVIKAMPKWKPGKQQGKPVRVAYTLPIKFKLE